MKKSYSIAEALQKLRHYCAYQERCHKEVKEKLYAMNMIPQAVEQITGTLVSENYLNESRFAQQFTHGKFTIKHWGKIRIVRELKVRAVSDYDIQKAIMAIDTESYLNTLTSICQKKWNQLEGISLQQKKKKLYDYLAYRGWETELIYDQIGQLAENYRE